MPVNKLSNTLNASSSCRHSQPMHFVSAGTLARSVTGSSPRTHSSKQQEHPDRALAEGAAAHPEEAHHEGRRVVQVTLVLPHGKGPQRPQLGLVAEVRQRLAAPAEPWQRWVRDARPRLPLKAPL